jgi:DNA-directed RNA polymerase specialized sigma24 family protein
MNQDGRRTPREESARDGASAVRRFARALVGPAIPHTAETIAQEALAIGAQAEKRGEDPTERAFAEVVKLNRRRAKSLASQNDGGREQTVHPELERREGLSAQIAAMPLDEREILLVVALSQMSYEAAARILDVPHATAVSRLMRARARLDATRTDPAHRVAHLRLVK